MREGIRVVILGAPNVGKSTLLNCFAKENLAFVSDGPGTTRDLISVSVNLGGVPVEFVDTAGIHTKAQDPVEIEGMNRARKATESSDVVLEVVDVRNISEFERLDKKSILVFNKIRFLRNLTQNAKQGVLMREGIRVVILGAPNVGKSTLLNCFAKENLAIVSDGPGTTRDLISVSVNLGGVPVEFVDTAGIHTKAQDPVEIEGMNRARKATESSDVVLEVVDVRNISEFERLDKKSILVFNKIDLLTGDVLNSSKGVFISAANGNGITKLIDLIIESAGLKPGVEVPTLSRRRHIHCLDRATINLKESAALLKDNGLLELVAESLLSAQINLGEITNPISSDALLGEIFSEFCIGK
jgi:small GTP-binding protein